MTQSDAAGRSKGRRETRIVMDELRHYGRLLSGGIYGMSRAKTGVEVVRESSSHLPQMTLLGLIRPASNNRDNPIP